MGIFGLGGGGVVGKIWPPPHSSSPPSLRVSICWSQSWWPLKSGRQGPLCHLLSHS